MSDTWLTIIGDAGVNKHKQRLVLVKCVCGVEKTALASAVKAKKSKSCGCLRKSLKSNLKHGKRHSRLYTIWCNIKARCNNPAHPAYKNYGGRGIKLDKTWEDFKNFEKDVGECPGPKFSIDRKNNDGNYEPNNVRWATKHQQSRNKRDNVFVKINGQVKCAKDWCKDYNISYAAVYRRMRYGEDIVSAITRPKAKRFA